MASVWDKIDSGLAMIYANFLRVREQGAADMVRPLPVVAEGGKLHVVLRYEGDLGPVENAGFETIATDGHGQASGALRLEDLQAIAERDEVLTIRYGSEPQLDLDISVPQINANKVWTLAPGGVFSGNTGAGVIVGIIDTGADIHHKFLWRRTIPNIATRILRIWDMGLEKVGLESEPAVGLLDPLTPGTYGVEYTEAQINDVLRGVAGAMSIRHKDCSGHGTHVASIAAGDGRFAFKKVGVAPRADLIVVKLLHLAKEPKVGVMTVNHDQRFKDAVTYIRKVADSLLPPWAVVINYSAGNSLGAHDGLDVLDDWLANEFRDAASAGKIFVTSAGNSAGKRQHARIVFPAAGVVEIPFELFDTRVVFTESVTCAAKDNTKSLLIDFYYPSGGATLSGELKPHGEAAFTAGPALGAPDVSGVFSGRTFTLVHKEDRDVLIGGAVIKRNQFRVILTPNAVTRHLTGTYAVRLTASAPVTVHVWCFQHSRLQGIQVKPPPPPLPPEVTVEDKFLVGSPGCAGNVITVAAYDAEVATLDVTSFSSRGPVPRHGVGGAPPAKPDVGAPGAKIDAAKSANIIPPTPGTTQSMNGTSMSAPHVTGAVALLLEKNKTLTPSQVRTLLQTHALKVPPPVADDIGAGRLDAKKAFDNTP